MRFRRSSSQDGLFCSRSLHFSASLFHSWSVLFQAEVAGGGGVGGEMVAPSKTATQRVDSSMLPLVVAFAKKVMPHA